MICLTQLLRILAIATCSLGLTELAARGQGGSFSGNASRLAANQTGRFMAAEATQFPVLSQAHQEYLDQVLDYWQHSSGQIKKYRCTFRRWQYDTVFGPRNAAKTIATGIVRYAQPDKGMLEVTKIEDYKAGAQPDGQPQYVQRDGDSVMEKWVCNGQSVFEFDYRRSRLIERRLPPELQGNAIAEGPLPFLFGVDKERIKRRYWVRVITPEGVTGEYWLEAWPRTRQDAANFKMVEVIIDEKDFLPKAIQIYDPNYDGKANLSRTSFAFENRQVNPFDLTDLDKLQLFVRQFHEPKLPKGWKKEVIK